MSRAKLLFVATVCLVNICLGICADASLGASCDNKCRVRDEHKFCPGGPCILFLYPSCLLCRANIGNRCEDRETVVYNDCRPATNPDNLAYYRASCTEVCTCGSGILVVEAKDSEDTTSTVGTVRNTCQ